MTLALWLFVALGATDAAVTYRGVPAEVVRIEVYEWRQDVLYGPYIGRRSERNQ